MLNKKRILFLFNILFSLFIFSSLALSVKADNSLIDSQLGFNSTGAISGYFKASLQNSDPRIVAVGIINIALGFVGVIFLGLLIFAGFKYMTAAGNEDQVKKSISQIKQLAIGFIIILASWGLTRYILNALIKRAFYIIF